MSVSEYSLLSYGHFEKMTFLLQVKSMIVSAVALSTHEMISTNAKDEEMSNKTTL